MMRASDLAGKRVLTEQGTVVGRVLEIRVEDSKVTYLICGIRGLLQRLGGASAGKRVNWLRVKRVTPSEIIIADS